MSEITTESFKLVRTSPGFGLGSGRLRDDLLRRRLSQRFRAYDLRAADEDIDGCPAADIWRGEETARRQKKEAFP
jgi:hypothetical protein